MVAETAPSLSTLILGFTVPYLTRTILWAGLGLLNESLAAVSDLCVFNSVLALTAPNGSTVFYGNVCNCGDGPPHPKEVDIKRETRDYITRKAALVELRRDLMPCLSLSPSKIRNPRQLWLLISKKNYTKAKLDSYKLLVKTNLAYISFMRSSLLLMIQLACLFVLSSSTDSAEILNTVSIFKKQTTAKISALPSMRSLTCTCESCS